MLDRELIGDGFFQSHHQKVRASMDDVAMRNFFNLDDDTGRVAFMMTVPQVNNFDAKSLVVTNKCKLEAARCKADGNACVQRGDWRAALVAYTAAYLRMPVDDDAGQVAVVVANRSAALYYLKQYDLALRDIDIALSLGYPKRLKHKICDRKAKCYLALKWNREAILAFRDTLLSLDDSDLPKDKCKKKQTDAQLMIEILEKSLQMVSAKGKKPKVVAEEKPRNAEKKTAPLPEVYGKRGAIYPNASDALAVEANESEGRHVIATRDVDVGETLIVEKPHCSVLLGEFSKTHCQHCFERSIAPVACDTCANVAFCSIKCKRIATDTYHRYECPILMIIWQSGCSITCHMALRIMSQRSPAYFKALDLNEKPKGKYSSEDYRRVYDLVGHESVRAKADFFQRTHMAVFLLKLLTSTDYLESPEDETFVGSLILRNLQILQFNAHEIFELQCDKTVTKKHLGRSVFLGGGLFPMLALLNHSCEPGIVRYFQGTSVIAKSIKSIKKGEQVSENYGPIFTRKPAVERKRELKDQYWFDCHCVACEQNWPMFEDMDEGIMRFRCDAGGGCNNVIPVPINCQEFLIKCSSCQRTTNIFKGLKTLQDTDSAQKIGMNYMDTENYPKALQKFVEELKLYEQTLVPPFKDYHLCQQNLRRCYLTFGNVASV